MGASRAIEQDPGEHGAAMTRGRRVPVWLLAVLFLGIPLLELYVLIQVGQVIGVGWTILLLIADSLLGGWLIKREGGKAFRAFNAALSSGRMPAREMADGILVLAGRSEEHTSELQSLMRISYAVF